MYIYFSRALATYIRRVWSRMVDWRVPIAWLTTGGSWRLRTMGCAVSIKLYPWKKRMISKVIKYWRNQISPNAETFHINMTYWKFVEVWYFMCIIEISTIFEYVLFPVIKHGYLTAQQKSCSIIWDWQWFAHYYICAF